MNSNEGLRHQVEDIKTECRIRWSEFRYHLISHLIQMNDRDLASDIELCIFDRSWEPNEEVFDRFIAVFTATEGPEEFDEPARELVREVGKQAPWLVLKNKEAK